MSHSVFYLSLCWLLDGKIIKCLRESVIGNVPFSLSSILKILKVIALTLTQFFGGEFRAPSSRPHWLSHSTVICDIRRRRQRAFKIREWSHILRATFLKNDFAFEIRLPVFEFLLVGKYTRFPLFLKIIDHQWCYKIFYSCNSINPSNSVMAEETETSQVWLQKSYFFLRHIWAGIILRCGGKIYTSWCEDLVSCHVRALRPRIKSGRWLLVSFPHPTRAPSENPGKQSVKITHPLYWLMVVGVRALQTPSKSLLLTI